MKTLLISLAVLLASVIICPASAQIVNGYDANKNAIFHPQKDYIRINVEQALPVKNIFRSDPTCIIIFENNQIAKYVSPLGAMWRNTGNNGKTQYPSPVVQSKKAVIS